ncbi:MAG: hypothetical protein NVSMB64_21060 [Candidatus Velthaea sp.]
MMTNVDLMDAFWIAFDVVFERTVERFVFEARQLPIVEVQIQKWIADPNGTFRFANVPAYWTDQSLGSRMPYWEEFLELEKCALASPLVTYLNEVIGGSGLRIAFQLMSFTLATIGDALRTTHNSVDYDRATVKTRLSNLRDLVEDPYFETEILILVEGVQLEQEIRLDDDLSVRHMEPATLFKFFNVG